MTSSCMQALVCPQCHGCGKIINPKTLRVMADVKCDFCDGKRFVAVDVSKLKVVNPQSMSEFFARDMADGKLKDDLEDLR